MPYFFIHNGPSMEDLIGETFYFQTSPPEPGVDYDESTDPWITNLKTGQKEWAGSLIYSYDLIIPDNAIQAELIDGAHVITHLDWVTGTDIALIHTP